MIKIGSVVQANMLVEGPFRSGNTYRVKYIDDVNIKIGIEGREVSMSLNDFHDTFKLIADTICPACLKGAKKDTDQWCKPCEES